MPSDPQRGEKWKNSKVIQYKKQTYHFTLLIFRRILHIPDDLARPRKKERKGKKWRQESINYLGYPATVAVPGDDRAVTCIFSETNA